MFDYLVVGAGFAGSVLAERLAADAGKKVLIIDRRPHIGGNAYDHHDEAGILVHRYGPHIFHTNSREVFEQPNSIFVARHLGQPSINEVSCRLSTSKGALILRSLEGSFSFTANGSQRAMLEKVRSDVLVGIRPQHIHVANGRSAGQVNDARVEAFEALGATGVLIAEIGGVSLTALTSPEADFEPGQPIRLELDVGQFLYFDAVHGRNLQA